MRISSDNRSNILNVGLVLSLRKYYGTTEEVVFCTSSFSQCLCSHVCAYVYLIGLKVTSVAKMRTSDSIIEIKEKATKRKLWIKMVDR